MFKRSVRRSRILPLTQRGGKAGGSRAFVRDTEEGEGERERERENRVACLRNALSLEGPSDFLVDPPRSL